MEEFVNCMTFSELKELVKNLEKNEKISDDTKVFLDTGWDSLQEVLPDAVSLNEARPFKIQDELTKEYFGGYALAEKSNKFTETGDSETVIVIANHY